MKIKPSFSSVMIGIEKRACKIKLRRKEVCTPFFFLYLK